MNFCFVVETGHSLAWVGTWGQTHDPVNTALRTPGASAVTYGGIEAKGIVFDVVADALRVPNTDTRSSGKPESFARRRMGAALASDANQLPD